MKNLKLYLFLLPVLTLLTYSNLLNQFLLQDEWHHLGMEFLWHNLSIPDFAKTLLQPHGGIRFIPLGHLASYIQYSFLGLNIYKYAIASMIIHVVNTFLLYLLAKEITKNDRVALITSAIFAVSATHYQAVTWLMQHTKTLLSASFAIVAFIYYFKYLKKDTTKHIAGFIFALTLAVLIKETAFMLFPAVFLIGLIRRRENKKGSKKILITTLVIAAALFSLVGYMFVSRPRSESEIFIPQQGFLERVLERSIAIPLKTTTQSFVPQAVLEFVVNSAGSDGLGSFFSDTFGVQKELVLEKTIHLLSVYATAVVFLLLVFVKILELDRKKDKTYQHYLVGVLLILSSAFPLLFISTIAGNFVYLESRYLYLPSMGASLLLALFIKSITKNYQKRLLLLPLVMWIGLNVFLTRQLLASDVNLGNLRRSILDTIRNEYPKIPRKVVFYTESDKSYYGQPPDQRLLPFQSGFGQTLLVWYHQNEHFPLGFFKDDFLWNISDQDYKEYNDRGFGYFRDFRLMMSLLNDYDLTEESVIAYSYDSSLEEINDTTKQVRGRIRGYRSDKRLVTSDKYNIDSQLNTKDLVLVTDGDRETFWDSRLPYSYPQSLTVELAQPLIIAQVTIDSFDNKDQNEVGYRVSRSLDNENWQELFISNRYTPDEEGLTNLYFEPTKVKYVKIEQIGEHDYATWVLHEIEVYEAI